MQAAKTEFVSLFFSLISGREKRNQGEQAQRRCCFTDLLDLFEDIRALSDMERTAKISDLFF